MLYFVFGLDKRESLRKPANRIIDRIFVRALMVLQAAQCTANWPWTVAGRGGISIFLRAKHHLNFIFILLQNCT